jgi:hypothetical protein
VVDRYRFKDKKEERRINGWHGGCNERHNIQINTGEGGKGEEYCSECSHTVLSRPSGKGKMGKM